MKRFIILAVLLFCPLVVKVTYIPIAALRRYSKVMQISARADIVDAQGVILATTLPTESVYVIPSEVFGKEEIVKQISTILAISPEILKNKFDNTKSTKFIWLVRHITPGQAKNIRQLGLGGVYIAKDHRRFYPQGSLFNHILGNVDDLNNGITGAECAFDAYLKKSKEPLKLSLISSVQHILRKVLDEGKEKHKAKAVCGMIISAKTGKIISIYSNSSPEEMNPHKRYEEGNLNINTQLSYELGSIMKVLSASMFFSSGKVKLDSVYYAPVALKIGKFRITDLKRDEACYYTFAQAFKKSSNVVNGLLLKELGIEMQIDFFRKCGFFEALDIDGLQVVSPIFPKKWKLSSAITASYGYGVALSPAYFMQAFLRTVTGFKRKLHILEDSENGEEERVFSAESVKMLLELLRVSVDESDLCRFYRAQHFKMGGKTGTANKLINNAYVEKKNLCSYVFVFPHDDPEYIGFVFIDEPCEIMPNIRYIVAAHNALPMSIEIVKQIVPILNNKNYNVKKINEIEVI
jgi:cell division protein FtsI (penicillin-binding protein 3)